MAVLLRDALVLSPYEARRRTRLVRGLPSLPQARVALREGAIHADHVFVIADTLATLPVERREEAEASLAARTGVEPSRWRMDQAWAWDQQAFAQVPGSRRADLGQSVNGAKRA
ncbi:13E12 repeat family protein [Allokutzneria albata]|uniref:DUF222 domain-containing protein n=1 Tax=Allokutzneria albata TaxID=211114 RepID=UPI0012FC354E|nr:DUF222 domain-containing protein [Allokutzneria albata]